MEKDKKVELVKEYIDIQYNLMRGNMEKYKQVELANKMWAVVFLTTTFASGVFAGKGEWGIFGVSLIVWFLGNLAALMYANKVKGE
jgi:hypothetical protein